MKTRSTKRNTEKFQYHRRVAMFDDCQPGAIIVLPETMESGLERQHWPSGEPCTDRSWRTVPPVNVGNPGYQGAGGQQTAASVCSAKPENENVSIERLYSGAWSQHTQGDQTIEFPHGHSKKESGFYTSARRCTYNQEMQDSGQFRIGNRPHDYAYSNVCRDVPLETTYPKCHFLTGLLSANPLYERFVTSGEQSCNCPSFEQQPYCSDDHSQPYCHPNGPNSIFHPSPGWYESLSTERTSLIPVKGVVVNQSNDTHVFNLVAQFGNSNAPSAAQTKVGKDCKLYVSPGTRPNASKTRFVPSILKHVAVKGRKSAIMKCNINAKSSVVRKILVNENEVKQSSNLKQDKKSKVSQQDRLASASLEPKLGHTHTIRQEPTVIKRTPLDNVNSVHQKSETQDSQSSTYPSQKAKKYMYLKSYPRKLSKTPQHEQQEKKLEFTMSGVIGTGHTGILTVEKSHEDPIPNYIKRRVKCGGNLEQVVTRLKARGQGNSEVNAIDLTTDCVQ